MKADDLFWAGCTAILEGFDDIYSDQETFDHFFSTWENQNLDFPVRNVFPLF